MKAVAAGAIIVMVDPQMESVELVCQDIKKW